MNKEQFTKRNIGRVAGVLYLLLVPLGVFGLLYFQLNIVVDGDVSATIKNIINNEFLFRMSILSSLTLQIIFILLGFTFYKLFIAVDKNLSTLMLIFVLVSIPISMSNEIIRFSLLHLLDNPQTIKILINLHTSGVFIAQIFWGLWLLPLGILIYKSAFIPKLLGILMMIACFGYVVDSIVWFLYPSNSFTLSEFTFLGEVLLPLWLVFYGIDKNIK